VGEGARAERAAPMTPAKVFGIGFHKTGTSSLGVALRWLGYRVCNGADPLRRALGGRSMMGLLLRGELEPLLQVAEGYDAFRDNPWFVLYRSLDQRFPGSRFVLTERDEERWLLSALRYFGSTDSRFRRWIYGVGTPIGNTERWLERYRQHNHEVKQYFRSRPADLLVVDWEKGHGWAELCSFLGQLPPPGPFPRVTPVRRGVGS
jgi:hypothetical protein